MVFITLNINGLNIHIEIKDSHIRQKIKQIWISKGTQEKQKVRRTEYEQDCFYTINYKHKHYIYM